MSLHIYQIYPKFPLKRNFESKGGGEGAGGVRQNPTIPSESTPVPLKKCSMSVKTFITSTILPDLSSIHVSAINSTVILVEGFCNNTWAAISENVSSNKRKMHNQIHPAHAQCLIRAFALHWYILYDAIVSNVSFSGQ